MPDTVNEIVEELERYGVPSPVAVLLIAQAITIGAEAAVYRRETAERVADLQVERHQRDHAT